MLRDEPSIATWRTRISASSGSVDILPRVDTSADEITMCPWEQPHAGFV
jgi:hypothetical protein